MQLKGTHRGQGLAISRLAAHHHDLKSASTFPRLPANIVTFLFSHPLSPLHLSYHINQAQISMTHHNWNLWTSFSQLILGYSPCQRPTFQWWKSPDVDKTSDRAAKGEQLLTNGFSFRWGSRRELRRFHFQIHCGRAACKIYTDEGRCEVGFANADARPTREEYLRWNL